jgi:hypothetical protein
LLRTDAIWEKEKLRDWFRLYTKCFYFDKNDRDYKFMEVEDVYTILFEGWALDDLSPWTGHNPTGRTNSFQVTQGPKNREAVSAQLNFIHADYFELYHSLFLLTFAFQRSTALAFVGLQVLLAIRKMVQLRLQILGFESQGIRLRCRSEELQVLSMLPRVLRGHICMQ